MEGYADLADLPEDERIEIIARTAKSGRIVGVAIDDEDEKVDRYIRKLTALGVRIIDRGPGLVKHTVLVRVGPKGN